MAKNIPPLNALRAFEAASRLGGFVRAAQELHVTPAAVSHQIKQLEHWLGMELFVRSARGVALTTSGLEYASRIRDAFDKLLLTTRAVRANQSRSVVTIRAQFSLAAMWLMPRLPELLQARPDIDIKLAAQQAEAITGGSNVDIEIYHERTCPDGFEQIALVRGEFSVYAAPALLARMPVTHPSELLSCPLLHFTFEDRSWKFPTFESWFEAAGVAAPPMLPGYRFNLMHLAASACVRGIGFALLHEQFCAEQIRAGNLVKIPGPAVPSGEYFYVLSRKRMSDDVAFVRDWLVARGDQAAD
ncbi:MAG: LysR family transcriptional regulator [Betaproteobacteria bacterium]|nr:MAG: LysR family transcriptional regulator [Betaproteobacteria bacterium]TAG50298.1 MAG: LysR family transcriptional regulator [Betaproteobacteria bacterium]